MVESPCLALFCIHHGAMKTAPSTEIKIYKPGKVTMPDGKETDWEDGGGLGESHGKSGNWDEIMIYLYIYIHVYVYVYVYVYAYV